MRANCDCFLAVAILVSLLVLSVSLRTGNSIESNENKLDFDGNSDLIEKLREEIKIKDEALKNAQKINTNFERMIQLVNIMGQVDTFLTDRTRLILKKLSLLADDINGTSKSNSNKKM